MPRQLCRILDRNLRPQVLAQWTGRQTGGLALVVVSPWCYFLVLSKDNDTTLGLTLIPFHFGTRRPQLPRSPRSPQVFQRLQLLTAPTTPSPSICVIADLPVESWPAEHPRSARFVEDSP